MIPFAYSHRNLRVRWKTTLMTASGFTLVVAALVVMLAFVNGMIAVCTVSGERENVLVLSRGNADEILSRLDRRPSRRSKTIRNRPQPVGPFAGQPRNFLSRQSAERHAPAPGARRRRGGAARSIRN